MAAAVVVVGMAAMAELLKALVAIDVAGGAAIGFRGGCGRFCCTAPKPGGPGGYLIVGWPGIPACGGDALGGAPGGMAGGLAKPPGAICGGICPARCLASFSLAYCAS